MILCEFFSTFLPKDNAVWPEEEKKEESVEKEEEKSERDEDTNTQLSHRSENNIVEEDIIQKSKVEEVYAEPLIGTTWKQVRDFGTQVSAVTINKNKQHNIKSESYMTKLSIPPSHGGTFHVSKDAVPLPAPSECLCRRYSF